MKTFAKSFTNLFALWVIVLAAAAFQWPHAFRWFQPWIVPALGLIMFGMGATLTPADFRRVLEQPRAVAVGLGAQYLIMPLWGWCVARWLSLPAPLAAGVILVGCCPGGTASNVMTYLARGDVALSVTLTALSTLLAVAATPYLTAWLAGTFVPVNATELLWSVAQIILLPVTAGLLARKIVGDRIQHFIAWLPVLSVIFIVMIIACVVALTRDRLLTSGLPALIAVVLHNAGGLALGYLVARVAGLDVIRARTIAIEVGMQNSGLGVALARKHFADALVALPGAIFSVCHNLTGSALATYWSRHRETPASPS
ncbi:MAG: bile acid:sodium symporter family protein [Verrucomicrobiae bacterium]|nr:bile acid:sodium symporter family protein [Verrucomicrobiae bacterium]